MADDDGVYEVFNLKMLILWPFYSKLDNDNGKYHDAELRISIVV